MEEIAELKDELELVQARRAFMKDGMSRLDSLCVLLIAGQR
jgi:hypothetical protein